MCNNLELEGEKGCWIVVVEKKVFRGPMTTTRLEGLVVRTVSSCLGYLGVMGIEDREDGSRKC